MTSRSFEVQCFIRLKGDNVLMREPDGGAAWIPLTDFSMADQTLARRCHERSPNGKREKSAQTKKVNGYAAYRPFKSRRPKN